MSSAAPTELNASTIISLIESGAYPREVVATVARGFLPLAQEDLVTVLAYLTGSPDEEMAELARASLADVPARIVLALASNPDAAPEHLVRLARASRDNLILEALIQNRALPDEAVVDLAAHAEPQIQEVIVINHARILRAPEILEALLTNPSLSPDARRRALETREEFFEKKARAESAVEVVEEKEEEIADIPLDAISDLLEEAAQEGSSEVPTVQLSEAEKKDPGKVATWAKIQKMGVSEKVKLAFGGDKTARLVLVRERNKLICSAVMRNPRITEQEVEAIAGMRNVEDEVLRLVGLRRDWMSKYGIILALCRNPKAPAGVVVPLINRLTLRDLKGLKDDKGVSQVVRQAARRVFLARTQKKG